MKALALEFSSEMPSLALFDDERPAGLARCPDAGRGNRALFEALDRLLRSAALHPRDLDLFIVGRGPGRYSGLRAALTIARFLALPGGKPVFAVSSGAALAAVVLRETGGAAVAVLGDARRGECWYGVFRGDGDEPHPDAWRVAPPEELPARLPPEAALVSPDYERLLRQGVVARLGAARWRAGDRAPDAVEVGRLALRRRRAGIASEPLSPLYPHPAVAAARRPPADNGPQMG